MNFVLELATNDLAEGVDHLKDGAAAAGAQVPSLDTGLVIAEVVQGDEVALGEVDDVDIIADGGTVAGRVVVSKDQELVAITGGDFAEEREQIKGNTLGVLAHDASGVGTAGVEIAQDSAVPLLVGLASLLEAAALSIDLVGDDILDDGLGAAVGIGRTDRAVLGDGDHVLESGSIAIDGSTGGEDNVGDIVPLHRAHQTDRTTDIDTVVLERDLARLANGLESSEVDNGVDSGVLLEDVVESGLVGDVELVEIGTAAADELDAVEGDLRGIVEGVDNYDVVAVLEEGEGGKGANVAGATVLLASVISLSYRDLPGDENSSNSHCCDLGGVKLGGRRSVRSKRKSSGGGSFRLGRRFGWDGSWMDGGAEADRRGAELVTICICQSRSCDYRCKRRNTFSHSTQYEICVQRGISTPISTVISPSIAAVQTVCKSFAAPNILSPHLIHGNVDPESESAADRRELSIGVATIGPGDCLMEKRATMHEIAADMPSSSRLVLATCFMSY